MKKEFQIFCTTLLFFTRIPIKPMQGFDKSLLNKCTRYFPLVGYLVGIASVFVFWAAQQFWPPEIAIILSIVTGILITGSFHEDGFGDVFDGFGGGWTKPRILEIMKDSRLGTYGTVALIFMFLLKFYALLSIVEHYTDNWTLIAIIFITYHALARTTAITLSFILPYSREDATSKSKPLATHFTWKEVVGALFFGLVPLAFLLQFSWYFLWIIPVLSLLLLYSKYYFNKWIDGFTGDCLGAIEQFAELFILLSIMGLWKFI